MLMYSGYLFKLTTKHTTDSAKVKTTINIQYCFLVFIILLLLVFLILLLYFL